MPQNDYWKYFLKICTIPHTSGNEAALRDWLKNDAESHGLSCRVDAAGNLAIDRAAAEGFEKFPRIILQAHLDMVPQVAPGVEFDFLRDPIVPVLEGDWVTTGGKTTLGADDGMGLALAMEILTDKTLKCGALRAVFTVSEETGLGGAEQIAPEFLDADILFNLDGSEIFIIGCAGGSRFEGNIKLACTVAAGKSCGVKIHLKNMHGGHSGEDIHRNLGSAVVELGRFLAESAGECGLQLAEVKAGSVYNAIARAGEALAAVPADNYAVLAEKAQKFAAQLNAELIVEPGKNIELEVSRLDSVPLRVLTAAEQEKLFALWQQMPHGLLASTPDGGSETSCNFASVTGAAGKSWNFTLLARSLYNFKRSEVTDKTVKLLRDNGFDAKVISGYSSWEPQWDAPLLKKASDFYRSLTGKEAGKYVIHGGLEPGTFAAVNPDLQMLTFAPEAQMVHSPSERLSVSDSEAIRQLLRQLLTNGDQLQ